MDNLAEAKQLVDLGHFGDALRMLDEPRSMRVLDHEYEAFRVFVLGKTGHYGDCKELGSKLLKIPHSCVAACPLRTLRGHRQVG